MIYLILVPFVMQGLLMGIDEFYFHQKRMLPKFERWGHPCDTLTVIFPAVWVLSVSYSHEAFLIFMSLAILSCVVVTKDEWVHQAYCSSAEHWIHAMLFLLHPLIFVSMFLLWQKPEMNFFLIIELILLSVFLAYQTLYWNVYKAR